MKWLMKNVMIGLMMTTQSLSQQLGGQLPGSQRDEHGCVLDGGYQWCDSLNECVRPWMTPCSDVYVVDTPPMPAGEPSMSLASEPSPVLVDPMPIDPMPIDPMPVPSIPYNCATWYDGCNTCQVTNGAASICTMMACFITQQPECLSYYINLNEGDICYRFCEDGSQGTVNRQENCPSGSECTPPNTISYDSCNDNAWKCISGH